MQQSNNTSHSHHRRGFTIAEVLVVLSLLVLFFAMTLPPVLRMAKREKFRDEIQPFRQELVRARVHALDTGLIYQFRFEPDGRAFLILPWEAVDPGDQLITNETPSVISGQLPEGYRFVIDVADALEFYTEQLPEDTLGLLANSTDLLSATWSPALLFSPDGTAERDLTFTIQNDDGLGVRFSIRGITADLTLTPVRSVSELALDTVAEDAL